MMFCEQKHPPLTRSFDFSGCASNDRCRDLALQIAANKKRPASVHLHFSNEASQTIQFPGDPTSLRSHYTAKLAKSKTLRVVIVHICEAGSLARRRAACATSHKTCVKSPVHCGLLAVIFYATIVSSTETVTD
jgi:hypothetical protein